MPLTYEQTQRLAALRAEFMTSEQFIDIIGVNPRDSFTWPRFLQFGNFLMRRRESTRGELISRFIFESFLQHQRLLPFRKAALQLGMDEKSLREVIERLSEDGRAVVNTLSMPEDLIDETFIKGFYTLFHALNNVIFSDHTDYCSLLHEAIQSELSFKVNPLYCTTSSFKNDTPIDFANSLCALSHQPTSIRNEVMMNFGKPFSLSPDTCSRIFIHEHQAELGVYVLGAMPQFDDLAA